MDDVNSQSSVRRAFDGGWGGAPYLQRTSFVEIFSPGARRSITPLKAQLTPFEYWSRSPAVRLPLKVGFCVRRKQRREVLFAMKRAGFRGSAPKRHYRRTQNSQYRC